MKKLKLQIEVKKYVIHLESKSKIEITNKELNKSEQRKYAVAENINKLKKGMTLENTERILQGRSPFVKEKVKLLYFSGFKRNTISYTKMALIAGGIPKEALSGVAFIGKSVLELIVKVSKITLTIEVCENLKGSLLRNFNPLQENTYEGDVRERKEGVNSPSDPFRKRMDTIIKKGNGPIGLYKIIRNSNENNITRFLESTIEKENKNDKISQNGEYYLIEPNVSG
jgi:hypothetical protein